MKVGKYNIKKKYMVLLSLIGLFLLGRAVLPQYLLKKTNEYLANFNPNYSLQLEDFDLGILRGAYQFQGITGKLKDKSKKEFLNIKEVDVSIAWKEIFKGRIVSEIVIKDGDFVFIKNIKKLTTSKEKQKDAKETLFPMKVHKLEVRNTDVTLDEYKDIDGKGKMRIADINADAFNLTPDQENPKSRFFITAKVLETSSMKIDGDLNLLKKPVEWNLDAQAKGIDLPKFNPILKDKLPLTFTEGTMDLYAEAKSTGGKVKGYVKPFMNNLDIVKNEGEDFTGIKHFGIEILAAVGNLILRDETKGRSVATQVDFTYDGKFNVNTGKAVSKALKHGFADENDPEEKKDKVKRGIENRIGETGGEDAAAE